MAAKYGHLDTVVFLLEHSADKSIKNKDGHTAYDLARIQGQNKIAALLR